MKISSPQFPALHGAHNIGREGQGSLSVRYQTLDRVGSRVKKNQLDALLNPDLARQRDLYLGCLATPYGLDLYDCGPAK
ncbi:hypothetical protein RR46_06828 [Papilio xuthus]|uniref:Uncharacterized protein n=1 Tax=Papilio xuthus TaxID=66420 RepID=A0A194PTL3_PAPXU|nr:hypothetical protein RR46_06828 [Papilio xuthus]